ncbi:hypothetical protein ATN84_15010 [Paramesorhizobium deserti]|uniref:Uncharacterized protein n=1 Tax=Paramesorhizobium deserti TaxID=1494590 RepID=A0A135HSP3_9HYPH|nr:hypothetical protein [Paramesorhizobium deserti]KXF76205.1 hypothetical protein ATN84_15010 [Paramesorhizobium deserti]
MEQLAAIMLLVTCSNDLAVCHERPAPTVSYETITTCQTELKPAIENLAAENTRIYGKCVEVDPEIMEQDVAIYWEIDANDELKITIREEHEGENPTMMAKGNPETGAIPAKN